MCTGAISTPRRAAARHRQRRAGDDLDGVGQPGADARPAAQGAPALPAIHAKVARKLGPHICTGPVAVKGAKPGQVLQVEIEAIDVAYDWGYNAVRPLAGALPDDFPNRVIHITLDRARRRGGCRGARVPLAPFFGVMATAPPPAWGMLDRAAAPQRRQPRQQGAWRRRHALSADLRRRCAVLGRRRSRRARRRRGLHHRGRDRRPGLSA